MPTLHEALESNDEENLWPQNALSLMGRLSHEQQVNCCGKDGFTRPGVHAPMAVCSVCFRMLCSSIIHKTEDTTSKLYANNLLRQQPYLKIYILSLCLETSFSTSIRPLI